jgi:hypothetical protein
VAVAVGRALTTWLSSRRSEFTIEIKQGDRSIKLNADNPEQAAKIIEVFLAEHPRERGQDAND